MAFPAARPEPVSVAGSGVPCMTPKNHALYWAMALSLAAVGLAGCTTEESVDTDPGPGTDIGPEPGVDESVDLDPGPGTEIGPEPGPDDSLDTDPGPGTDLGPEENSMG